MQSLGEDDPFLTGPAAPQPPANARSASEPSRPALPPSSSFAAEFWYGPTAGAPRAGTAPQGPQAGPLPPDPFAGHTRAQSPPDSLPQVDDPFLTHNAAARREEDEVQPAAGSRFPNFSYYRDLARENLKVGGHRESMFPEGCFGDLLGHGDERAQKWIGYLYILLPYGIFLLTLFLGLVVRHSDPTLAILLSTLLGVWGLYTMMMEQMRTRHGNISLTVLGALATLGVVLGLVVGSVGWQRYVRQAWWLQVGITARNVSVQTPAAAFNDAAWLQFTAADVNGDGGAYVDVSRSAGFKDGDFYCAAPILASLPPEEQPIVTMPPEATVAPPVDVTEDPAAEAEAGTTPGDVFVTTAIPAVAGLQVGAVSQHKSGQSPRPLLRVEFWAIGINCCNDLGHFTCAQQEDFNGGLGLVLLDEGYPCPGCNRERFAHAVRKAESSHGLVSSPGALKVQWMVSRTAYHTWVGWRVALFVITSTMLVFLIFWPIGWSLNYYGIGRLEDPFEFVTDFQLLKMRGGRGRGLSRVGWRPV